MTSSVQGGDGLDRVMEGLETKETVSEQVAEQVSSQDDLWSTEEEATPAFSTKLEDKKESVRAELSSRLKKMIAAGGALILPVEKINDSAEKFSQERQNPELDPGRLAKLGKMIKEGDTKEEILSSLREVYKDDYFLASEALDFLLTVTFGTLAESVKAAKSEFAVNYSRQIDASRNIQETAVAAAKEGLGKPEELRKSYDKFTWDEPDSITLFEDLQKKCENYEKIEETLKFLLSSLGADMKPLIGKDMKPRHSSLPREKLQSLVGETKTCQAILGIYNSFKERMGLVKKLFDKLKLPMPAQLTFENIAKQFVALVRSSSEMNIAQIATKLGIENSIPARIIVFNQMLAVLPRVAPRIYRSSPLRDDATQRRQDTEKFLEGYLEGQEMDYDDLLAKMAEEEMMREMPQKEKDLE